MNTLVAAFDNKTADVALTQNGAVTLSTSGAKCVDLFAAIGSAQNMNDVLTLFEGAYREHKEIATRVALWGRDARGGAGRREAFRFVLRWLEVNDFDMFTRVLAKTPELGRWDDVLAVETDAGRAVAYGMIGRALAAGDRLCAKWMPRKATPKDDTAARLREYLGLTPRQYRKLLVRNTAVVETAMCAKNWAEITYEHVPSVAAARYARAFKKNDEARYNGFIESLKKDPTKKINTSALYPHDLYRTAMYGNQEDYANEAWKRLPNYLPDGVSMLALVDTSGSMGCTASGQVQCIDVAVSLGLYLAEKNSGPFANRCINFNDKAEWISTDPNWSLRQRFQKIYGSNWGGSTNFQSAFDLILTTAVKYGVRPQDMPQYLLVLSDMEFNACVSFGDYRSSYYSRSDRRTSENFAAIDAKYAAAGYKRPKVIFWNLNARAGNSPVKMDEGDTALISGFSPAIMRTVLSQKTVTPLETLLDTVGVERYNIFD